MPSINTQQPKASAILVPPSLKASIADISTRLAAAENPDHTVSRLATCVQARYESCYKRLYHSFIYACEQFAPFYESRTSHITVNKHKKDRILGRYIKSINIKSIEEGLALINDNIAEISFCYDFSLCTSKAVSRSFDFKSFIIISFDSFAYTIEAENCVITKPFSQLLSDIEIINIVQSLTNMHQKTIVASIRSQVASGAPDMPSAS